MSKTRSLVREVVKKTPHNGKKDIEETIGDKAYVIEKLEIYYVNKKEHFTDASTEYALDDDIENVSETEDKTWSNWNQNTPPESWGIKLKKKT